MLESLTVLEFHSHHIDKHLFYLLDACQLTAPLESVDYFVVKTA